MIVSILFVILGVVMVVWGADRLTSGAAAVARKMRVPEIVIGVTIVAFGTSAPELAVSMSSALQGTPDMALGNVIGSNIFNILLITGCAAALAPITVARATVTRDLPCVALASVVLLFLCMGDLSNLSLEGGVLSRTDGMILLAGTVLFLTYNIRKARRSAAESDTDAKAEGDMALWRSLAYVVIGLAALIVGSDVFVAYASEMASQLGVSDSVIGLTIVAGGTSMPELATTVVAAKKGNSELAIGNVIGSNVLNILLILGATAAICPLHIEGITAVDIATMLLSAVMLWYFSYTRFKVERWEGLVMLLCFAAYIAFVILQSLKMSL